MFQCILVNGMKYLGRKKINENGNYMFQIDPAKSNLTQIKADSLVKEFKKLDAWGWLFGIGTTCQILRQTLT